MKTLFQFVVVVMILTGCATDSGKTNTQSGQPQSGKKQPEKNPEVGMTKAQVIEMYGKTDNITQSSDGEIWVYQLNLGEAFIPFNFGYRPKTRLIAFDQQGLVRSWSYTK